MHPSVTEAWPALAHQHEGVCYWPYLDTKGLVTTGVGTLLDDGTGDPPDSFLSLPWTTDDQSATRAQNAAGWLLTKSHQELAPRGGFAFRDVTTLRLHFRVVEGLLTAKTREFWSILHSQLPGLEEWPADAQLSLIDMAYQLGPRFLGPKWPNFTRAAHARDFTACAAHCTVRQASASRNARRQRLFHNAAKVTALGIDPAILWDDRTPIKEDDMPLTDDDIARIAKAVAAEIKAPSKEAIAAEVLSRDGLIDNTNIHPTGGSHVTLATAVEELHRKVDRLKK